MATSISAKLTDHRLAVLSGHEFKVKSARPSVVRIFLSSTFKDFVAERNHLYNHALPLMQLWCAQRGLEFQVVDLRWGIRDHVVLDAGSVNLCIREIEHCQQLSIGPNFVAFVGDRYGHRPLPKCVPAADMQLLLQHCDGPEESELISAYYELDRNEVPPLYLLKSLMASEDDVEEDQQLVRRLRQAITHAAIQANSKGALDQIHPFIGSVTEQEIWKGILDVNDAENCSLCFIRNFKKMQLNPKLVDETAAFGDYLHPVENGKPDPIAARMLKELKSSLSGKLAAANLYTYNIAFDDTRGVNPDLPEHNKYLKQLSSTFVSKLQSQITRALKESNDNSISDDVYQEVAAHAEFAANKTRFYCGQNSETFDELYALLERPAETPYCITGPSGVGKTSTIAKLVQGVWTNLLGVPNVVYRFLGTTPKSSSLDALLASLTLQISQSYNLTEPGEESLSASRVVESFHDVITAVGSAGEHVPRLIIVLDSLDQLSQALNAHQLGWIPARLPANVTLLLTCMLECESIWRHLRGRTGSEQIYSLQQISNASATKALVSLLSEQRRTLQPHQLKETRSVFDVTQNPLFLHLVAVEASKWHSFTPASQLRLGTTLLDAVNVLFDRLQLYHGPVLLSHVLGYLVLASNGLTEVEMEEVLSLDDRVLNEVYLHWSPPSNNEVVIPPLIWTRLKQDMHDFIMNRQEGTATVLGIYHKQFTDVIKTRYLDNEEDNAYMHGILAEFFSGIYATQPKPLSLSIWGSGPARPVLRSVRPQPNQLAGGAHNRRKLLELPLQLCRANMGQLYDQHIVSSFSWWQSKCDALGVAALIDDLNGYRQRWPQYTSDLTSRDTLVEVLHEIQHLLQPAVSSGQTQADCLAFHLLSKLSLDVNEYRESTTEMVPAATLERLLAGAREQLRAGGGLLPVRPGLGRPTGLISLRIFTDEPVGAVWHDEEFLLLLNRSRTRLAVFALSDGSHQHSVAIQPDLVVLPALAQKQLILLGAAAGQSTTCQLLDYETGLITTSAELGESGSGKKSRKDSKDGSKRRDSNGGGSGNKSRRKSTKTDHHPFPSISSSFEQYNSSDGLKTLLVDSERRRLIHVNFGLHKKEIRLETVSQCDYEGHVTTAHVSDRDTYVALAHPAMLAYVPYKGESDGKLKKVRFSTDENSEVISIGLVSPTFDATTQKEQKLAIITKHSGKFALKILSITSDRKSCKTKREVALNMPAAAVAESEGDALALVTYFGGCVAVGNQLCWANLLSPINGEVHEGSHTFDSAVRQVHSADSNLQLLVSTADHSVYVMCATNSGYKAVHSHVRHCHDVLAPLHLHAVSMAVCMRTGDTSLVTVLNLDENGRTPAQPLPTHTAVGFVDRCISDSSFSDQQTVFTYDARSRLLQASTDAEREPDCKRCDVEGCFVAHTDRLYYASNDGAVYSCTAESKSEPTQLCSVAGSVLGGAVLGAADDDPPALLLLVEGEALLKVDLQSRSSTTLKSDEKLWRALEQSKLEAVFASSSALTVCTKKQLLCMDLKTSKVRREHSSDSGLQACSAAQQRVGWSETGAGSVLHVADTYAKHSTINAQLKQHAPSPDHTIQHMHIADNHHVLVMFQSSRQPVSQLLLVHVDNALHDWSVRQILPLALNATLFAPGNRDLFCMVTNIGRLCVMQIDPSERVSTRKVSRMRSSVSMSTEKKSKTCVLL